MFDIKQQNHFLVTWLRRAVYYYWCIVNFSVFVCFWHVLVLVWSFDFYHLFSYFVNARWKSTAFFSFLRLFKHLEFSFGKLKYILPGLSYIICESMWMVILLANNRNSISSTNFMYFVAFNTANGIYCMRTSSKTGIHSCFRFY